jgi:hypothetical protein
MQKLIEKYLADPSLKNAKAIRTYSAKHMMAACLLTPEQAGIVQGAVIQANQA